MLRWAPFLVFGLTVATAQSAGLVLAPSDPAAKQVTAKPRGALLLSISVTHSALSKLPRGDNGFYFYLDDRDLVSGRQLRGGQAIDLFGGGTASSQDFLARIDSIQFAAFDFDGEVERAEAVARSRGDRPGRVAFDGATFEIEFHRRGVDFRLTARNPMVAINDLARYSPSLTKLQALLDTAAMHYGRLKMLGMF
jgi:hypothetical protein